MSHRISILCSLTKLRAFAYFMVEILRAKGFGSTLDLPRFLLQLPRQWLLETDKNPHIQVLLGAWGLHLDFSSMWLAARYFPIWKAWSGRCLAE